MEVNLKLNLIIIGSINYILNHEEFLVVTQKNLTRASVVTKYNMFGGGGEDESQQEILSRLSYSVRALRSIMEVLRSSERLEILGFQRSQDFFLFSNLPEVIYIRLII